MGDVVVVVGIDDVANDVNVNVNVELEFELDVDDRHDDDDRHGNDDEKEEGRRHVRDARAKAIRCAIFTDQSTKLKLKLN